MMRKSGFFVLLFLLFSVPALSAQGDVRICALTKAYECDINQECSERSFAEIELPRFVRIDFKNSSIISLDKNVKRTGTEIRRVDQLEGITVLQGVEQRGWSIALGQESGSLTLSAAGDEHGFIVFGSCMDPQ